MIDGSETAVDADRASTRRRLRLNVLVDHASFSEVVAEAGTVCGEARISGRPFRIVVLQQGVLLRESISAVSQFIEAGSERGWPLICIFDSAKIDGAQDLEMLKACSEALGAIARCKNRNPLVSLVLGQCVGFAAIMAAMADIVFLTRTARLGTAEPAIAEALTGEPAEAREADDARMPASMSGIAHAVFSDEAAALAAVRRLADYLPMPAAGRWRVLDDPARRDPALQNLVPKDMTVAIDMPLIARKIADDGELFVMGASHGEGLLTAFARFDGRPAGIVANLSAVLAGALDAQSLDKARRFLSLCQSFHMPVLFLLDSPGLMPGEEEDRRGAVRHAAELAALIAQASVAVASIVIRHAHGPVWSILGGGIGGRGACFAWPGAAISLAGSDGGRPRHGAAELRALGIETIDPVRTREHVIAAFAGKDGGRS